MSSSTNFLAVDLGASGGRVVLGRWDGHAFTLHIVHRFPNVPQTINGHLYWDIYGLWWEIKKGLALYASQYGEPVASIGVDSWAVDFGLLDEAGQLLGPPVHYRDHRTDGLLAQAVQRVSKAQIYAQTGLQFLPFNTLYQLYSMAQSHDPQLEHAATFLMIPDLFHYWLSGRKVAEYSNATTTQFFAAEGKRWSTGLLTELAIPHHFLPPVVQPGTILGDLLPEITQEIGLNQSPPIRIVAPGSHDTASAVAGVPGLDSQSAYISSGTWSLVGAEVPAPILTPAALTLNFTNEGGVGNTIRLLKNVMGLWLVQECQRTFREEGQNYSWDELFALSQNAPAFVSLIDPDAPEFLNPTSMPDAIRAMCARTGQTVPQDPGALMRCCLESLALKYRLVLDQLEQLLGHRLDTIRVVGGGSQNALLCQYTANASGRPVVAGPVEATALGNIMVQAIATGYLSDIATGRAAIAANTTLTTYTPSQSAAWDTALARFARLLS